MSYIDRNFMIFNVSELNQINFDDVLETSTFFVRKSTNNQKTFVKWDGLTIPSSVQSLTTKEGPYTYTEMVLILNSTEWKETIFP